MNCPRCAREIEIDSGFCRFCGAPNRPAGTGTARLVRIPSQGKFGGVCAGIADYLGVDVTLIRLAWVLLAIVPGGIVGGVVAYLLAWAVMPEAESSYAAAPSRQLRRSATDVKIAGVCGGIAEYFGLDATVVRVAWAILTIIPGAIVLGVLAYLVAWLIMPPGQISQMTSAPSAVV